MWEGTIAQSPWDLVGVARISVGGGKWKGVELSEERAGGGGRERGKS